MLVPLIYFPFNTLYRLPKQGVLFKTIAKVVIILLCGIYTITTSNMRNGRTMVNMHRIGNDGDNTSGFRMFLDHIVSHQPRMITQYCCILANKIFRRSVLHVDSILDFIYCHMIGEVSSTVTMESKYIHKRDTK